MWERPDSIVCLARRRASVALAKPSAAEGRSGWSLVMRSQETTRALAVFNAVSASDSIFGSRPTGGVGAAATALAERAAVWAGVLCDGPVPWVAKARPKPLGARQRWHFLW